MPLTDIDTPPDLQFIKPSDKSEQSETFEELEERVAKEFGRTHLGYPCDLAQDIKKSQGYSKVFYNHIEYCDECKKLLDKLEAKIL